MFVAGYMQVAQQLTGVNAFLSYATIIFKGAGVPDSSVPGVMIGFQCCGLVGVILGLILVDSAYGGRRSQLMAATVIMGPPLVFAGIIKVLIYHGHMSKDLLWLVEIAVFLYLPGFQFAWGIIPWVYPAEIFGSAEKEQALSVSTFVVYLLNFIVTALTPHFTKDSIVGWTFMAFGLLNVTNFIFVLICVKETKGKTIEENVIQFDGKRDQREVLTANT